MSQTPTPDVDVVIVGGRPAGASLAARLGRAGVRTAIVERARMPSYPAVSTPFLLPHAMALLDELGLTPERYAPGAPWIDEVVLAFGPWFAARFPLAEVDGRSAFVVLDRADFDGALWDHLGSLPAVEAVDGFTVTDVLFDASGRACGVRGRGPDGPRDITARAVIGADGRFSRVARAVEAPVVHARDDVPTHIYYAFWEGVAPFEDGPPVAHIHASLDGWSAIFMPMSRGRVSVAVQAQSGLFESEDGSPADIYARTLRARPPAWRRLEGARQVGPLRGFKRMGNAFRAAAGPGWALVGDAWHHKDSIDAQGIYDALAGARMLAEDVVRWHRGEVTWDAAMADYERRATAHCRPMFDATMERVKREVYGIPPPIVARTALKWLLTDREYRRRFGELLVRKRAPSDFLTPGLAVGALARGAWADLRARLPGGGSDR